jgi:hypothetical protein
MTIEGIRYPAGTVLLDTVTPGGNDGALMVCTGEVLWTTGSTPFGEVTSGLDLLSGLRHGAKITVQSVTVTLG